MKKRMLLMTLALALLALSACGPKGELVNMASASMDGMRVIHWEGRVYVPFCVVSKGDRGAQMGYVDGDTDDRISEYRGYSPEEWLVSWLPMDGGAMLLKERGVTEIPEGLTQEYP